ncbi:DEAD/DEAH box helicase [Nocardia terpenica]|uniref:Helicase n=1 Tax=Nocardia terpenica TaxID=455432 RepID=A0A6G9ZF50_9NOCA|nr:DEAD/DEAH box helicase [Nocardia terpenica]QIS23726.1 hypothetical protein F6W96_41040 [Nocardia terpenica]
MEINTLASAAETAELSTARTSLPKENHGRTTGGFLSMGNGAPAEILRPYQREIVDAVVDRLEVSGQVHMACGSGKTIVAQHVAQQLVAVGTVVVVTPSLALVAQTLRSWRANHGGPLTALAVCSDDTVADAPVHLNDLVVPVTTDAAEIAEWLDCGQSGLRLLVSTYASVERVAAALRDSKTRAAMAIFDEAHLIEGDATKACARVLDPDWLPVGRRLYLTATPRLPVGRFKSDRVASMADERAYGPVLARYSFARGIAEGYLSDYRIVVIGIGDRESRRLLADTDTEYVTSIGASSLQAVVAQFALARAHQELGIRRVVSFHTRVEQAAEFAGTLGQRISDHDVRAAHVEASMPHRMRAEILGSLENPPANGWTVVSNARCLGVGVDVPAIDAVLFADPKESAVDIVQAVGRALRKHPDSPGPSTIIVPIVVPDTDDTEIGDLDAGRYTTLWKVVRALRAHDEQFAAALDRTRGELSFFHRATDLPGKITMVLPDGISARIADQLRLLLVRQTTSHWWEGFEHARRFHAEHDNLLVPRTYVMDDGFDLGSWIARQRSEKARDMLPQDRIDQLTAIDMVWSITELEYQEMLAAAREYKRRNGHLQPSKSGDDQKLHGWLRWQRRQHARGNLPPEKLAALTELGVRLDHDPDGPWREGLTHAREFREQHDHLNVPTGYRSPDGYPLGKWAETQMSYYRKGILAPDRVEELKSVGMVWDKTLARWELGLTAARNFHALHGHLDVPSRFTTSSGYPLGAWIRRQRRVRAGQQRGLLPAHGIAALDKLGMRWEPKRRSSPKQPSF